jgi:signal transduction histidine kinase
MFVHQALAGDGTLTARVTSLSGEPGLAPWAKAGIILEPDTNQGTAYAAVMVTGAHGVRHARIAERQRIAREMFYRIVQEGLTNARKHAPAARSRSTWTERRTAGSA